MGISSKTNNDDDDDDDDDDYDDDDDDDDGDDRDDDVGTVIRLANYYTSNMVLQGAPQRTQLWGYGAANYTVGVRIDEKTVARTRVVKDGTWSVRLPPMRTGGPHNITVYSNEEEVSLHGVMFGDVWLCSGQSNMVFEMYKVTFLFMIPFNSLTLLISISWEGVDGTQHAKILFCHT